MNGEAGADLGSSLVDTLASSDLPDVLKDLAEAGLDSLLVDGVVKDIPVIGTIVGLGKAAVNVRDYFLLRKVVCFLQGMDGISPEEWGAFVRKVEANAGYGQRVGETIMLLLDRYDHLDKASLLSRVLCGCIKGDITYDEFLRISTAIERAFIADLNGLLKYFASEDVNRELRLMRHRTTRNVYMANLSDFYVLSEEEAKRAGLEHPQIFHFNQYAAILARVVLGDRFHGDRW